MAPVALDPTRGRRRLAPRRAVGRPCAARAGAAGRYARFGRVPRRFDDQWVSRNRDQPRTCGGDRAVVGLRGARAVRHRCGRAHRRRAGIRRWRLSARRHRPYLQFSHHCRAATRAVHCHSDGRGGVLGRAERWYGSKGPQRPMSPDGGLHSSFSPSPPNVWNSAACCRRRARAS